MGKMNLMSSFCNSWKENNGDKSLPCSTDVIHLVCCSVWLQCLQHCVSGLLWLAVLIKRLYIKELMYSICFEHIASVNQLKANLFTPHKIRRILIWHRNTKSPMAHVFQVTMHPCKRRAADFGVPMSCLLCTVLQ